MTPMGTRTVYSGGVWVAYGQAYVQSDDEIPMPDRAFGGQVNGLCGAAVPGALFLVTGTHTGRVGFIVEVHDDPPPIDGEWEEVVEASFAPASPEVVLTEWGGTSLPRPLNLTRGQWRVRYCARGLDTGRDSPPIADGDEPVDHYLLQFWPAPPAPDLVVRQTSGHAAYWHDHARRQPLRPTPEELAHATRRELLLRHAARDLAEVARRWGGRPPSERLRSARGNVTGLAQMDRDLVDALDRARPAIQRAIASWAARRACDAAGLSSLDWVATALDALDRGEPVPPPFDHLPDAFARLGDGAATSQRLVIVHGEDRVGPAPRIDRRYAAIPAVPAAALDDPLRAALDALHAAAIAHAGGVSQFLDEVRQEFPSLR
jgi:hypothetical protein